MNLRIFSEALTLAEVNELSSYLWEIRNREARKVAKEGDFLIEGERYLIENGNKIEAIKAIRIRLGLSLLESKVICDDYSDSLTKNSETR